MKSKAEYIEALATIDWLVAGLGAIGTAEYLGVHNVHIYKAKTDQVISPTLEDAMREKGCLEPKPTRTRFTADIPQYLKEEIQAERDRLNLKNNGEFLEYMWLFWKNFHLVNIQSPPTIKNGPTE